MAKKNNLLTHPAGFMETMDCLPVTVVPDGEGWTYEIKLDGFRLEAVKTGREVTLYSRRHNSTERTGNR
jgi:ATP-dependent DNA ligase